MVFCSLIDGLYSWIPVQRFRAWLIRVHMEKCPACQAGLVSRVEAMQLFVKAGDVVAEEKLWANVRDRAGIEGGSERVRQRYYGAQRRWQWAVGAATVLFGIILSFWLLRGIEKAGPGSELLVDRFEIEYLTVAGRPADPFIYQPKDSDMIFVWAEKINSGRDR